MSDQNPSKPRIFKIGAVRIVEDASMTELSLEAVRNILKATYPEIAHATLRETATEEGNSLIEFLPQPGRKG